MGPSKVPGGEETERVPLGTWTRLYAAVILWAFVVMALIAVFSSWRY
jgi:hypothetical protein